MCAIISAYFALRLADSIQYLLIAATFAGIAYFRVGSLQHIKRQLWGLVGWVEAKTEMSLPEGAKQNPMITRKG